MSHFTSEKASATVFKLRHQMFLYLKGYLRHKMKCEGHERVQAQTSWWLSLQSQFHTHSSVQLILTEDVCKCSRLFSHFWTEHTLQSKAA